MENNVKEFTTKNKLAEIQADHPLIYKESTVGRMTVFEAIASAMLDINPVGKDQFNQMQKFNYRGIDDVYNSLHPILAKYGLFSVPEVLEEKTEERVSKSGGNLIYRILKIKFTMYAADGSFICGTVVGEGMDPGDKAANKAMAVAHKYFLSQLFAIPTAETADPDKTSHEVVPNTTKQTVTKPKQTVTSGGKCPKCSKSLIKKSGKNGPFLACDGYPSCKYTQNVDEANPSPSDPK